ncbi:helix-turn-helix domain-containing protein [Streptomyces sp. bgisy034]|uniref:helix-turn-helix domain-containing protein n=1 Tax=Streptomyces sp. bgisy034 TaxID=3413774 RepID=UPI003EB8339C
MHTLGDFLRARREQLSPQQAGLPAGRRRRVPGLRREEVAHLAGISPEYYLRLEQGRNQHPSDQILESLAAALQLDDDAVAYLHRLAHPTPPARRRRPPLSDGPSRPPAPARRLAPHTRLCSGDSRPRRRRQPPGCGLVSVLRRGE